MTTIPRPAVAPIVPSAFPRPKLTHFADDVTGELFSNSGSPLVPIALITRTGTALEPVDKAGLSQLLTAVRKEGTRSRPGASFLRSLDREGIVLYDAVSDSGSAMATVVPEESADAAIGLLIDTVLEPELAESAFARAKRLAIDSVTVANANPQFVAYRESLALAFAEGSRGAIPNEGTIDAITHAGYSDLLDFSRHLEESPTTVLIARAGGIESLQPFGDRLAQQRGAQSPVEASQLATADPRVVIVDRPDAGQTIVRWISTGIERGAPGYAALEVASHLLGGAMSSRLSRSLREEHGYSYGVGGGIAAFAGHSVLSFSSAIESVSIRDALAVWRDVLDSATNDGFTDEEANGAVDELSLGRTMQLATPTGVVDDRIYQVLAGKTIDDIDAELSARAVVDGQAATAALAAAMPTDLPRLVLVGDGAELERIAAELFPLAAVEVKASER